MWCLNSQTNSKCVPIRTRCAPFRVRIPVASQVTALEIWLLACILLVFGALAEYAFILRQVIKLSRKTNGSADSPSALASPNNCGVGGEASTMMKVLQNSKRIRWVKQLY